MPKGKPKGGHKGRMKHYLNAEEIADQEEKKKREQDWKKKKGITEEEEGGGGEGEEGVTEPKDDSLTFSHGATGGRGLEEEEKEKEKEVVESSEEEESSDEEDVSKSKGVEHLIEIENPNRVVQKGRKIQNVDVNAKVELSRREREEIQRQKDAASYRKKHEAGRTEEAQRDLARLALIRQQREDAAKNREAVASKKDGTKKK